MTPAIALALAVAGQPIFGGGRVDPFLTETFRPVIEKAVEAELDPKRGANNAMAIIESAQQKYPDTSAEFLTLNMRRAAIGLRRIFLTRNDFAVPLRYEQALSTFARLDLTDPGLKTWILKTIAHHEVAKAQFGKPAQRKIRAALLLRGAELDRKDVIRRFEQAFAASGFSIEFGPAKEAAFVIKLASEGAKSPRPDQRAVRVVLGVEHIVKGEVAWRTRLFRTTTAPKPQQALAASVDWLARIGGRDLLFRWLGTRGLPTLISGGPLSVQSHGSHDHHDH